MTLVLMEFRPCYCGVEPSKNRAHHLGFRLGSDCAVDSGGVPVGAWLPGVIHRDLKPENILVANSRLAAGSSLIGTYNREAQG